MSEPSSKYLVSIDPGSSKNLAIASYCLGASPNIDICSHSPDELDKWLESLCNMATKHHVLLSLDAPLRVFGGIQAPDTFSPPGANSSAGEWPFDVNPFSQRACEHALCSKSPRNRKNIRFRDLAIAIDELCSRPGNNEPNPSFVRLHPGVSVLGYMSAPHAPIVRLILDTLEKTAASMKIGSEMLRINYDYRRIDDRPGTITILETHPAVALGFYARSEPDIFPTSIQKYKGRGENSTVLESLNTATLAYARRMYEAVPSKEINSDDELDALVGLLNLLDLTNGNGDIFGTFEDGYFLIPRQKWMDSTFEELWKNSREKLLSLKKD